MQNKIKVERAILNITQGELAARIAVSRQTINAMESNKYVSSTVSALKIARVFDKKVEDIFGLDKDDQASALLTWQPADIAYINSM